MLAYAPDVSHLAYIVHGRVLICTLAYYAAQQRRQQTPTEPTNTLPGFLWLIIRKSSLHSLALSRQRRGDPLAQQVVAKGLCVCRVLC